MNRPQRFRGLATDPGVQRKTPRRVIQRENKPKGPWLEEQFDGAGGSASSGKPASDTRRFRVSACIGRFRKTTGSHDDGSNNR